MVTFSLVVVRHGATDANEQGIIQGQSDHKLNEAGRHQASLLGRHFRRCQLFSSFTHSYSSDLSRARETAEIILDSLSETDTGLAPKWARPRESVDDEEKRTKLVCDTRLRERKYGVLEGKTTTVHKQAAMKSNVSPAEYTPEGGETLRDLYNRVSDFFRELCWRVAAIPQNQSLASATPRSNNLASTPPSPRFGVDISPQLQNGAGSNRNNRVQMPSSKVIRTSSLIPLPERTSPITMEPPASADLTAPFNNSHPLFYLPETPREEQHPNRVISSGKRVSSNGLAEEGVEGVPTQTRDAYTTRPSSQSDYSPFASSRDSGISAVSDGSLFVETQLSERQRPEDRPPKRSYSACSSPGFSPCAGSPRDSTDTTTDGTDKIPPTPTSMHVTNSWTYLYGAASRTVGARKVSVQSIASDDANFPDLDAQVLLVTHGGAIRELFRYFVDELGCLMIGGKGAALRPCPNTGVSSFMVNFNLDNEPFEIRDGEWPPSQAPKNVSVICLGLHSKEHLAPWTVPAISPQAETDEDSWFSRRPHTPPCDVSDFFMNDDDDDESEETTPANVTAGRESVLL